MLVRMVYVLHGVLGVLLLGFRAEAQARSGPTCPAGQTGPTCPDGSAPKLTRPPCQGGPPQCCTSANVCKDGSGPDGGGGGDQGGGGSRGGKGGGGGGGTTCRNPSCPVPPCSAPLLGDVGCTTVSGEESYKHEWMSKGATIPSNTHIFGPFEGGFTERHKSILENWGCSDASKAYDREGGTDIGIAEKRIANLCNIQLPRIVGDTYFGVVGPCGGHTTDYHFHRSFDCLYKQTGGHSTAVGIIAQWKLHGKWEDFANTKLPFLDACGGHFGPTPDSNGAKVYHYHVQDKAPFTVGCHGPTADSKLVSVAACRTLYSSCSDSAIQVETGTGTTTSYIRFCPCYDADGSNVGIPKELPALSTTDISYTASGVLSNIVPVFAGNDEDNSATAKVDSGPVVIKGILQFAVHLPVDVTARDFVIDAKVKKGVEKGIAKMVGLDAGAVSATLTRLSGSGRRLTTSGTVNVLFIVTIPYLQASQAFSVRAAIQQTSSAWAKSSWASAIGSAISLETAKSYTVTVTKVVAKEKTYDPDFSVSGTLSECSSMSYLAASAVVATLLANVA